MNRQTENRHADPHIENAMSNLFCDLARIRDVVINLMPLGERLTITESNADFGERSKLFRDVLLVAATLLTLPGRVNAGVPARPPLSSQKSCLSAMRALMRDSKVQSARVEVSTASAQSTTARIQLDDGEMQIVCDAKTKEMTILRILNVEDTAGINAIAPNQHSL